MVAFGRSGGTIKQCRLQDVGARVVTLVTRRRLQTRLVPAYIAAPCGDGTLAVPSPDGQLKMFNGLLQTVCRKLLTKIRELDCVSGQLTNLSKVCGIPLDFRG